MASPGLLAGLQGYASVAAAPGKGFGEGIVGAVDQGIGAYTAVSRVRQGDEEGARSQQRLDMAQAMQPGQLREQQLNLDAKGMAITEAGRRVERQKRQEEAGKIIREKAESGWYKDNPEDYKLDILNFTMIGEDPTHVRAAFNDYNMAVVQRGETADQLNRITSGYHAAQQEANAHTGLDAPDKAIKTWTDFISRNQKENFVGAAASPEFKHAHEILHRLVDNSQPPPIKDAFDKYTQNRAGDTKMTPVQAWHNAQVGMDPGQVARMNKMLKPADVAAAEEAERKGGDVAAEEAAKAPRRRAEIQETGKQHIEAARVHNEGLIALEREREKGREARQKPENAALKQRSDALGKRIATNRGVLTAVISSAGDKEAARQQIEADTREQDIVLREMATRGVTKEDAGGAGTPKGLSRSRVSEIRAWMGSAVKSMADVEKALRHPDVQRQVSPEDIAAIRGEYQRKFGGR